MKKDVYIVSLGCPRNLVDTEVLAGKLKEKGFRIGFEAKERSVAIVNTCGFIEDAKEESIEVILKLAELKKRGTLDALIVTGCLSQRYPKDLTREIPEIDAVFGSSTFAEIPEYIDTILGHGGVARIETTPSFLYNHTMPRTILTPRHTAYVKIQEGCKNRCSYCVIPIIRGPYRSRSMHSVTSEITELRRNQVQEINIIGQDTTLYGIDRYKVPSLAKLLRNASRIMKNRWVRLLYTHPAHFTDELVRTLRDMPSLCKYADVPVQHIHDSILKRMNRHVTKRQILRLLETLRKNIPNLAIRTSIIVGFPGESETHFKELESFIQTARFERLGVFVYSKEEGTHASRYPGQIPEKEKSNRFRHIMKIQQGVSEELNRAFIGRTVKVLIEEKVKGVPGQYIGRTEHDAPEVDGLVHVKSRAKRRAGDFVDVLIEDAMEYDLSGSVCNESCK
jgi:ribosomal protein S12 methylthiotransferase